MTTDITGGRQGKRGRKLLPTPSKFPTQDTQGAQMSDLMAPRQHISHEGILMYVLMYVCIPGPAHTGQVLCQILAFNSGMDKLLLKINQAFNHTRSLKHKSSHRDAWTTSTAIF